MLRNMVKRMWGSKRCRMCRLVGGKGEGGDGGGGDEKKDLQEAM